LTVTISLYEGDNSANIPVLQAPSQEVEQDLADQFFVEENNNGPVIVQGDILAVNLENFMQLGEGVQNIMLAYLEADAENPQLQNDPPYSMLMFRKIMMLLSSMIMIWYPLKLRMFRWAWL
jgi:hypothetical protein